MITNLDRIGSLMILLGLLFSTAAFNVNLGWGWGDCIYENYALCTFQRACSFYESMR